uniref:Acetyltransferase (GNAT) family protein n=1 Tax=Candidatus Kentrum sp. TUN TaxID=2126343 RepID=A0A450ZXN9_9GAMM|nr:MAG: Acetyltransferase (GNAT) family protein [Candidatus Kentron sp. TUN]VFK58541.1 MAG: Acetyltransferase (GNAT) family protein [Candidatus Kentron sp. TUN]VFK61047.1 MAG: Acetyltransferase (GNAT) family protein [Candidatus Kentron sp. TUN]
MTTTPINTVTDADMDRAIAVMVLVFSTDPIMRWIYREPYTYLTHFPNFVRKFSGKAFAWKTAYHIDDFAGVTLWRPPGVEPDKKEVITLLQRTVPKALQNDVFNIFAQAGDYRPHEPYWHLSFIGVDTNQQHRGLGSMLMEHGFASCDKDKKPVYLNVSNPKIIAFYERYGFELLGTIRIGSSPALFPMLRKPR